MEELELTSRLAGHVAHARFDDLPEPAIERAKLSVLDTIATAIGGSGDPITSAVRSFAQSQAGTPESRVILFGERLPAANAALVNATMARVLDFDETLEIAPNGCHASAYDIPAALALAERDPGISGAEFLTAVIVGMDVHCRLARSVTGNAVDTGRDNGVAAFGTTATASRLVGLGEARTLDAFGIAYAQAAGEFQMYEETAHTVSLQQGLRARTGIDSALLAQAGLNGPHEVFLGKYGFFRAFESEHDLGLVLDGLGDEYVGAEISFKAYPCCRCIHTGIGAMLDLREREGFATDEIAAIRIGTNRRGAELVVEPRDTKWNPRNPVTARFSLPYAVAVAAARGRVEIEDFTLAALDDRTVRRLVQATSAEIDPEIEATHGLNQNAPIRITVRLRGGSQHSLRIEVPFGHPERPAAFGDGEAKLRQCARVAERAFGEDRLAAIAGAVRDLENAPDLSALLDAVVA